MVSGCIVLNSFHLISFRLAQFHNYCSNPNIGTLLYFIMFRFILLYYINLNGVLDKLFSLKKFVKAIF
jgi:hypothetical protein